MSREVKVLLAAKDDNIVNIVHDYYDNHPEHKELLQSLASVENETLYFETNGHVKWFGLYESAFNTLFDYFAFVADIDAALLIIGENYDDVEAYYSGNGEDLAEIEMNFVKKRDSFKVWIADQ